MFISRDPLGFIDGMNLYAGYFAMHGGIDPMGLKEISGCDDLVNDLMNTALNNNKWYKGPDAIQRMEAAEDIANRYVPDSLGLFRRVAGGSKFSSGYNHEITGTNGLKSKLTQGGQNNAAYRHIGFSAASVLAGRTFQSKIADASDVAQAAGNIADMISGEISIEDGMNELAEREAELYGNEVGRNVGNHIEEFLDDEISEDELREKLKSELCEKNECKCK